jgi:hypothetical protein
MLKLGETKIENDQTGLRPAGARPSGRGLGAPWDAAGAFGGSAAALSASLKRFGLRLAAAAPSERQKLIEVSTGLCPFDRLLLFPV